jgi:UDP-N-acetylglucosamine 4,6-dehydratase
MFTQVKCYFHSNTEFNYMASIFDNKSILITGGTGSFGKRFVNKLLSSSKPRRLIIYSRDELKQFDMAEELAEAKNHCMRFFIGDVRDKERLIRATVDVDIVVHAAAMKQVVASEYNPTECIATNISGAQNVIDAAIANGVEKVIALSTDKAANPINLYGATKLCSDKLFIAANNLSGSQNTRFSVVRYGNVAGSRGSVIPYFKSLIESGKTSLPITDAAMTRFIITLDQGVDFVFGAITDMFGGEIFVPKLPSVRVVDIVQAFGEGIEYHVTGIRPGEKLHEVMIPHDEIRNSIELDDRFIIKPTYHWWDNNKFGKHAGQLGEKTPEMHEYASGSNDAWLSVFQLKKLIHVL